MKQQKRKVHQVYVPEAFVPGLAKLKAKKQMPGSWVLCELIGKALAEIGEPVPAMPWEGDVACEPSN